MAEALLSRRAFVGRHLAVVGAAALAGPAMISGCGRGDALRCTDTTGLTGAERQQRDNSEYVDATPDPERTCLNCNFWIPPERDGACGGCEPIKGLVHPNGYCNLWAPAAGAGAA